MQSELHTAGSETLGASEHISHIFEGDYREYGLAVLLSVVGFLLICCGAGVAFGELLSDRHYTLVLILATGTYAVNIILAALLYRMTQQRLVPALLVVGSIFLLPMFVHTCALLVRATTYSRVELGLLGCFTAVGAISNGRAWRFPVCSVFACAGIALVLWCLVDPSNDKQFALAVGLLVLVAAVVLNYSTTANHTFWLNKVGLLATGYGAQYLVNGLDVDPLYLIISLALLIASVFFRYPSYLLTAAVGVVTYINFLAARVYQDSPLMFSASLCTQGLILTLIAQNIERDSVGPSWRLVSRIVAASRPKNELGDPFQFGDKPV